LGFTISDEVREIYLETQHPIIEKEIILQKIQENHYRENQDGKDEIKTINSSTPWRLNKSKLDVSLVESLYSGNKASTHKIDPIFMQIGDFEKMVDKTFDKDKDVKLDVRAFVGGNTTVGSGGTYSTWKLFSADLGTFTSNGVAQQVSSISEEEANMLLSGVVMQIFMEEDVEVEEEPQICLLRDLTQRQWSALLPRIQYKIELDDENEHKRDKAANLQVIKLPGLGEELQIEPSLSASKHRNQIIELVENNPGQMSVAEYSYITDVVGEKTPCNFLIFGVGKDSRFWIEVNKNGKTVFLEDNQDWLNQVRASLPEIDAYSVSYKTARRQWLDLLVQHSHGIDSLLMELPESLWQTQWDFIFVDAPAGYADEVPGRMQSIYTAAFLAFSNGNTDVFVHDCDRLVETIYSGYFLRDENLVTQVGKLKHFKVVDASLRNNQKQVNLETRAYRNGKWLLSQQSFLKAILAFNQTLVENPWEVTALIELGQLSLKLGDLKEAKHLFGKAVSLERRNPLAMELLAKVSIDLNEYQDAVNILEQLVKIKPSDISVWSLLETCYRQIGWEEKATVIANHYRDLEAGKNVATLPASLSEKHIAKTEPKRILVINNLYPPQELGGYGRRICDFAGVLGKRGHTIHALASDAPYLGEIKSPEADVTRELLLCGTYEQLPPKHFADESEVRRVIEHNDLVIRQAIENYAPDVCLVGNIDLLLSCVFQ